MRRSLLLPALLALPLAAQAPPDAGLVHLSALEGRWKVKIHLYEPGRVDRDGKGVPAASFEAEEIVSVWGNGACVERQLMGLVMDQPFEGRSLLCYDAAKKGFIATWMDTMTPGEAITSTGYYDEKERLRVMKYATSGPEAKSWRETTRMKDRNHFTTTRDVANPDASWFTFMVLEYTRKP